MFNLFKKKCPVCKMELPARRSFSAGGEKGKEYIKGFGKEFCSEQCREEFRHKLLKEQSGPGGGSCH